MRTGLDVGCPRVVCERALCEEVSDRQLYELFRPFVMRN